MNPIIVEFIAVLFSRFKINDGRIMYKTFYLTLTLLLMTGSYYPLDESSGKSNESGRIIIHIENLKNQDGSILISLYNNPDGYPEDWESAFQYLVISADGFSGEIYFENIPFGYYVFAIIHDENDNLKLDRNLFGIPREGYAFSNNVRGRFGPPGYDSAKFELNKSEIKQTITLIY
jgi:uncharacterized protein (DUF2141 family)